MDSFSIHDIRSVTDYFDRVIKRPWLPFRVGPQVELQAKVYGIPVKIQLPREAWRGLTAGQRYRRAAWMWLRPAAPCPKIDELAGLCAGVGLDHVPLQTFAIRLIEACRELMRDHAQLKRWVEYRIAALDFAAHQPLPPAHELVETAMKLRNLNTRAHHLYHSAPPVAEVLARQILVAAMEGAGRAATQLFTDEEGALSANLMVPMAAAGEPFAPTESAARNVRLAEALWMGVTAERRLVVVGETRRSTHLGFWIPLARGEKGALLPGAATAFSQGQGHVVFKDDPPPLTGFGDALEHRWRHYMATEFRERLFLSLPFVYPTGGTNHPVAVLNVNVDGADVTGWLRAHHKEWLRLARDRVQPFLEIALTSLVIMFLTNKAAPRLDSGSDDWDTLPSVVPRLLPEGSK